MLIAIRFRSCVLRTWPSARHTQTLFHDGATLEAAGGTTQLRAAERCGYDVLTNHGEALYRYTRDHEALHHVWAEAMGLAHSPTLWYVAHGGTETLREHTDEEAMVSALHSLLRGGVAHAEEFADGLAMLLRRAGDRWPQMLVDARRVLNLAEGRDQEADAWE